MHRSERVAVFVLRLIGIGGLSAIPAILMPDSWIAAIHSAAGLGEYPDAPIVGYLARSLSAFYAFNGTIALVISFEVRRYRPIIRLLAALFTIMGFVLLGIDLATGMPLLWTVCEVPTTIAIGVVLFWSLTGTDNQSIDHASRPQTEELSTINREP